MDLGLKPDENSVAALPQASTPEEPKIQYPGFSLNGDQFDHFLEEHPVDILDELTATVKLRVTGIDTKYGRSISFDIMELNDLKKAKAEPEESDYPNPAIRKLMRSRG